MRSSYLTVADFFDGAVDMRRAFDDHFAEPHRHTDEHQVWNYWHVPDLYTYMRTDPSKVLRSELVDRFQERLNTWALSTLGLTSPFIPWLSLYVNGCGQNIHNDSRNGQMGFVFSLTNWDTRRFLGGETILHHPENYWESERIRASGAGSTFYELIPALFNQLLVFDDRVIHGVQPLQGTMEPLEGRVVMHGHLSPPGDCVTGALTKDQASGALARVHEELETLSQKHGRRMHGFVTYRLDIKADGKVGSVLALCDRLASTTTEKGRLDPFREKLKQALKLARFPDAAGPSEIITAILVD